jgi:hypothetical protein
MNAGYGVYYSCSTFQRLTASKTSDGRAVACLTGAMKALALPTAAHEEVLALRGGTQQ